jgi:site-specific DNA-cytosine methylase
MVRTDKHYAGSSSSEDTDEVAIRMGKDEDDPDDEDSDNGSDFNSIDAERDVQDDDDDDEEKPHPKPKVLPSYDWSHFFRGYIDTSWVDSQEKFHRDSGHGRQKFTGKQCVSKLIRFQWQATHEVWIQRCKELHDQEDGILTAREMQELQAKTRAMYSSAHLLNIQDRQIFDKPIEERLESRLSDLKAWVQHLFVPSSTERDSRRAHANT